MYETIDMFPPAEAPRLLRNDDCITRGTGAAWATYSADESYRYVLGRQWDVHQPWLIVCMLNPSTATETQTDPTIRRIIGFAKRDHYGGFIVINVCAYRSTDPRVLLKASDPVGPLNEEVIARATRAPLLARAVAAWGRPLNKRIERLMVRTRILGQRPWHRFGDLTNGGHPRHPLYLRSNVAITKIEDRIS